VKCEFGMRSIPDFFFTKIITKNMYFLFSIQILLVYSLMPESGILYFFGYVIFTNIRVENIHN